MGGVVERQLVLFGQRCRFDEVLARGGDRRTDLAERAEDGGNAPGWDAEPSSPERVADLVGREVEDAQRDGALALAGKQRAGGLDLLLAVGVEPLERTLASLTTSSAGVAGIALRSDQVGGLEGTGASQCGPARLQCTVRSRWVGPAQLTLGGVLVATAHRAPAAGMRADRIRRVHTVFTAEDRDWRGAGEIRPSCGSR